MSAVLEILRAGRRALFPITRGSVSMAIASASLALVAATFGPTAGRALAGEVAPGSAAPTSDVPPAATELFRAPLTPPYPDANDPVALGRWFGQTTHLPATSILAVTGNAIFAAFRQHNSGALWTVDVRIETITPQSTAKLGGRSVHLRLNVRCDNTTVRLSFIDVFPGADLTGAPTHRAPPNDWAKPKPDSYVADAVRLACDKTYQGPFAAVAAAAPDTDFEPKPDARAAAPETANFETRHAPALRARQPLKGAYEVQIGAYSSAALSEAAWRALKAARSDLTNGRSITATPVKAGGRLLYRAIVTGFASEGAATTFCQTLRTSGQPCLVVGSHTP